MQGDLKTQRLRVQLFSIALALHKLYCLNLVVHTLQSSSDSNPSFMEI